MQPHSVNTENSYLYGALLFNLLLLDVLFHSSVTACGRQKKILRAV